MKKKQTGKRPDYVGGRKKDQATEHIETKPRVAEKEGAAPRKVADTERVPAGVDGQDTILHDVRPRPSKGLVALLIGLAIKG